MEILSCEAEELRGCHSDSVESMFKLGLGEDGSQGRRSLADNADIFRRGTTKMFVQAAEVALEGGGEWDFC